MLSYSTEASIRKWMLADSRMVNSIDTERGSVVLGCSVVTEDKSQSYVKAYPVGSYSHVRWDKRQTHCEGRNKYRYVAHSQILRLDIYERIGRE